MPVPENQPERVRQQVVNWSAVMAFVAEWTIAIVSYIFVLLSGLIFGMLGGYADGIFLFIHEEWVSSGRQVGVTLVAGEDDQNIWFFNRHHRRTGEQNKSCTETAFEVHDHVIVSFDSCF